MAAVQKVLADAEFASEVVHHDYGEDLLVQTSHANQLDASRIWLQVKSSASLERHRLKSGSYSYSVPYDHAIRWVRSNDLVVVVLWDVGADVGYFAKPDEQVDQWHWADTGQASTTLRFDPGDVFDVLAAKRLAWEARIAHHFNLLLVAKVAADEVEAEREHEDEEKVDEDSIGFPTLLTLDFLIVLGVVDRVDGGLIVSEESRACFSGEIARLLEGEAEPISAGRFEYLLAKAGIVTLLTRVKAVAHGAGLPATVIHHGVETLLTMLQMWDLLDEVAARDRAERG